MKCCASTDVETWTNWLTFEPDQDYSRDAGTGLLSPISYKRCYAEFYVGKIPPIRIGGPALQLGLVFKWFYSLSRRITFVGGSLHALYGASAFLWLHAIAVIVCKCIFKSSQVFVYLTGMSECRPVHRTMLHNKNKNSNVRIKQYNNGISLECEELWY